MAGGYSVTFSVVDNATRQIDAINRRMAQLRAPMERLSKQVSRFVDVSGLRKVAEGFEWIGKAAMGVFRSMSAILAPLGVITGAATLAGMVKLVSSYADWSHTLVQTANNLGVTTQSLQQMQDATRLAGGSAEDMTSAMKALHDAMGDYALGRGNATETAQAMNLLGIKMKDANGNLRDTAQVTREVIDAIAKMPNPVNRARLSAILLGGAGDKLVESLRQSHRSIGDWFTDAGRYTSLTDKQIAANQRFVEAQGRLGVAFDTLGGQIAAILTRDFGPLLDRFAQFVERNTPAILKAVDELSARFASWLGGIKWEDIETGLKAVGDNLGTIAHIVEVLVGMQLGLWFVKAAAGVAQLTAALGSMGGAVPGIAAAAGGAGLLGALAGVAALLAGTYLLLQKGLPALFGDRPGGLARPNDTTPNTTRPGSPGIGPHHGLEPSRPGGTGHGGGPRLPAGTAVMPAGTVTALPGDTSWGDYGTRANNPGNLNYADWEGASGKFAYTDPHTGGAHTMATFATMPEGIAAAVKLMQRNQAKYGATLAGALHGWAENPYVNKLGMDPNAPFDVSKVDPQVLAGILGSQFRQEGRKGTHTATPEQILAGIELARRPPPGTGYKTLTQEQLTGERQSVPIAPPVRGSVDVSITHKNGPPNSAVTATGSGAVNVAPVRVEHQDMASI